MNTKINLVWTENGHLNVGSLENLVSHCCCLYYCSISELIIVYSLNLRCQQYSGLFGSFRDNKHTTFRFSTMFPSHAFAPIHSAFFAFALSLLASDISSISIQYPLVVVV